MSEFWQQRFGRALVLDRVTTGIPSQKGSVAQASIRATMELRDELTPLDHPSVRVGTSFFSLVLWTPLGLQLPENVVGAGLTGSFAHPSLIIISVEEPEFAVSRKPRTFCFTPSWWDPWGQHIEIFLLGDSVALADLNMDERFHSLHATWKASHQ